MCITSRYSMYIHRLSNSDGTLKLKLKTNLGLEFHIYSITVFALECDFASLYTLWDELSQTNSPTRLHCHYQAKHSKLTEEICLLSEATMYIFPHRNI